MTPAVVHIASFAPSYGGNFVASLKALSDPCKKIGLRLVLVFLEEAGKDAWCADLVAAGHTVHFMPANRSLRRDAKVVRDLIEEENAAIVHTHFMQFETAAWVAIRAQPRGRRPQLVWHAHSSLGANTGLKRGLKDCIKYRWMGRHVQMVAVSEHVRQQLMAKGLPENRIRTILNGIDLARATTAVRTPSQVRHELRMADHEKLVLMLAWDPVVKGVDLALDAAGRLALERRDIVLGIVGTDIVRQYLAQRGIDETCPWMRIIPPTEDIAALFQTAALFLSASRSEGFSYAACEAFANAIPVVLSDIPAVAWAHDCPAASFFVSGDSHGLERAIRESLDGSADERQKRTLQSREFIQREFDVKIWAQQMARFYTEML